MKLKFDVDHTNHPDPFVLKDGNRYYLYASNTYGEEGVPVYTADDPFGEWHYAGIAAKFEGARGYWAPSVIKYKDSYYMYLSFGREESKQFMHVAKAESPLGPFENEKMLYREFSIDSHAVETEAGLFLFYAKNKNEPDLTKVEFTKVTKNGGFNPILIGNSFEEGTGHHSMIKLDGEYYAFYHARDIGARNGDPYQEIRTARVCKIHVDNGVLRAEMKENEI